MMQIFQTHTLETPFSLSNVSILFVRPLQTEYNRREAVREKHGFHTIVDISTLLLSYLIAFSMPLCTYQQKKINVVKQKVILGVYNSYKLKYELNKTN